MTIYGRTFTVDKAWIQKKFGLVADWSKEHNIPTNRIFIGEFGCGRRVPGAADYLRDTLATIKAQQWHWAFYAYREDGWDGLDYELGTAAPPAGIWRFEAGSDAREAFVRPLRAPNPLWDVIAKEFAPAEHP